MIGAISEILTDVFKLFIPSKCSICALNLHKFENFVCKGCLSKLPKTGFYQLKDNPISQIFWGRVKLEYALACYYFTKGGSLQDLIHLVKYSGAKDLAYELGKEFGYELKNSGVNFGFDVICPVPLHPKKEKKRGYNQSDWLARGIAEVLEIPYDKYLLKRVEFTSTQTRKNRQQRWENVKEAFDVSNIQHAKNKHILIVDDVLTTGATLEACAQKLIDVDGVKVSIAALAYASDF